jgi:hypothetical protein
MKHARTDYDRIQDPAGLIPEDEPVFLLRGQDKYAAKLVELYADIVEFNSEGETAELVKLCRDHAQKMRAWPKKKSPDL